MAVTQLTPDTLGLPDSDSTVENAYVSEKGLQAVPIITSALDNQNVGKLQCSFNLDSEMYYVFENKIYREDLADVTSAITFIIQKADFTYKEYKIEDSIPEGTFVYNLFDGEFSESIRPIKTVSSITLTNPTLIIVTVNAEKKEFSVKNNSLIVINTNTIIFKTTENEIYVITNPTFGEINESFSHSDLNLIGIYSYESAINMIIPTPCYWNKSNAPDPDEVDLYMDVGNFHYSNSAWTVFNGARRSAPIRASGGTNDDRDYYSNTIRYGNLLREHVTILYNAKTGELISMRQTRPILYSEIDGNEDSQLRNYFVMTREYRGRITKNNNISRLSAVRHAAGNVWYDSFIVLLKKPNETIKYNSDSDYTGVSSNTIMSRNEIPVNTTYPLDERILLNVYSDYTYSPSMDDALTQYLDKSPQKQKFENFAYNSYYRTYVPITKNLTQILYEKWQNTSNLAQNVKDKIINALLYDQYTTSLYESTALKTKSVGFNEKIFDYYENNKPYYPCFMTVPPPNDNTLEFGFSNTATSGKFDYFIDTVYSNYQYREINETLDRVEILATGEVSYLKLTNETTISNVKDYVNSIKVPNVLNAFTIALELAGSRLSIWSGSYNNFLRYPSINTKELSYDINTRDSSTIIDGFIDFRMQDYLWAQRNRLFSLNTRYIKNVSIFSSISGYWNRVLFSSPTEAYDIAANSISQFYFTEKNRTSILASFSIEDNSLKTSLESAISYNFNNNTILRNGFGYASIVSLIFNDVNRNDSFIQPYKNAVYFSSIGSTNIIEEDETYFVPSNLNSLVFGLYGQDRSIWAITDKGIEEFNIGDVDEMTVSPMSFNKVIKTYDSNVDWSGINNRLDLIYKQMNSYFFNDVQRIKPVFTKDSRIAPDTTYKQINFSVIDNITSTVAYPTPHFLLIDSNKREFKVDYGNPIHSLTNWKTETDGTDDWFATDNSIQLVSYDKGNDNSYSIAWTWRPQKTELLRKISVNCSRYDTDLGRTKANFKLYRNGKLFAERDTDQYNVNFFKVGRMNSARLLLEMQNYFKGLEMDDTGVHQK